jgi:hypothetical protein
MTFYAKPTNRPLALEGWFEKPTNRLFGHARVKEPRRGRVTYKTNIDSMYIYNNTTFNVRV